MQVLAQGGSREEAEQKAAELGSPVSLQLKDVLDAVSDWRSIQAIKKLLPPHSTIEDIILALDKIDASHARVVEEAIKAGVPLNAIEAAEESISLGYSAEDAMNYALLIARPEVYDSMLDDALALGAFVLSAPGPARNGSQDEWEPVEEGSQDEFEPSEEMPQDNPESNPQRPQRRSTYGLRKIKEGSTENNPGVAKYEVMTGPGKYETKEIATAVDKMVTGMVTEQESAWTPEAWEAMYNVIRYADMNNKLEDLIRDNLRLTLSWGNKKGWEKYLDEAQNPNMPEGVAREDLMRWVKSAGKMSETPNTLGIPRIPEGMTPELCRRWAQAARDRPLNPDAQGIFGEFAQRFPTEASNFLERRQEWREYEGKVNEEVVKRIGMYF